MLRWMIGNIKDLCQPTNSDRFTCAGAKVVYNASLIWGTIGPQRMFQAGQVYNGLMYFFLIGVGTFFWSKILLKSELFSLWLLCSSTLFTDDTLAAGSSILTCPSSSMLQVNFPSLHA